MKQRILAFAQKAVPLWMVFFLVLNTSFIAVYVQSYLLKKQYQKELLVLSKTTKNPEELVQILKQKVLPQKGHQLSVSWGRIGQDLVEAGAIDKEQYRQLFGQDEMKYMEGEWKEKMTINEKNSRFLVDTLWAFGLTNKSKVLDEGSMQTYGNGDVMGFASTGGWNLGTKPTSELYSSQQLVNLTSEQEKLVEKIAKSVYRPCCNNSTEFPDCNHGMAALGYIQLAVSQGVSEDRIYKDLLALNSFWFPQQSVDMAMYFSKQGREWKEVDPKQALSFEYSSSTGVQKIQAAVQTASGISVPQGGCAS